MDITAQIARFVADHQYDKTPPQAVATAKTAVLDCLGVALAGSKEVSSRICADIARHEGAREEATVFGQGFRSSALQAAFANGASAHALDFDHSFTLMGQPTAPIIPAVFALGESVGASGRQILEAYVAGFEVTAKLAYSLRGSQHDGWHAPSTLGSFGASAACAKLLGLNSSQVEMALGIAASMAGGVVCNFGTMTKPLHVGLGARNGVLAAKLAQSGYTANAQAIEASVGFYDVFHGGTPIQEEPLQQLGRSYALVSDGIRIKPYPCGGLTHQAIDAVLQFRQEHGITGEMVEAIDVDVTRHTYDRIAFRIPETGIQGKFCMGYLLARAIVEGTVAVEHFTDEAVRDQNILKLAEKIQMKLDPALKPRDQGSRPCRVTMKLKNGKTFSREVHHSKGGPEFPLTAEELKRKFATCARRAISEASATRAAEYVERLETLDDIKPLCELLMGAG